MDIIDIMLARAMTPQGKTETYLLKAEQAAQKATAAEASAAAAIQTVEDAADEIATAREEAAALLEEAQETLETAQQAQINTLDTEDVDDEIKKLDVSTNLVEGANANTYQVITTYPDNTLHTQNATKMYKSTGANEDGTMTQKAITNMLENKADISALAAKADKTYVDQKIATIPSGGSGSGSGANTNLGQDNSGKIVVVDENGDIAAGIASEEDIITALIINGGYTARNAVGIEIDYDNKSFVRVQQAADKSMGSDFDTFPMYGGRRRCIVNDNGEIIAFYGEENYVENNPNYQVMIYQPKFYYQRVPLQYNNNKIGKVISHDSIIISSVAQTGFKLHPLFINTNGEELNYVLLGAYEGGYYSSSSNSIYDRVATSVDFSNDKLVSNAGTKPITGASKLTLELAEQLASNRGTGWHIYTIEAESANQMLEFIEFGTLNGQEALGKGITLISNVGDYNCSAITGATSSLGNTSGIATSTNIEINNDITEYSTEGKNAISYRGMENPWGNTWTMLGGIIVYGNSLSNGGIPYICKNYNYSYDRLTNDYESAEFSLPNGNGWIAALGYGAKKYDWLLMPAAVGGNANSVLPVGDNGWYDANLNGYRLVAHGGSWSFEDADGPLYYACDKSPNNSTYRSYGVRLMFIPTKNAIYNANIEKWQQEMGG